MAARLRALADPAPARVIYVLSVLGVADELANEPRRTEELAKAVGADEDALRRVLRAAAGLDLVALSDVDTWTLCPSGMLLRTDVEDSLRAEFADNDMFVLWNGFLHSVRTGEACYQQVFGAPIYQRLGESEQALESFHRHMFDRALSRYSLLVGLPVWPRHGSVVDVGGGTGGLVSLLLHAYPELSAVLFDLPEVIRLAALPEDPRLTLCGGDLFADAWPQADVYVLASVLHDFPDHHALRILESCRAAGGTGIRLLVLERILPDEGNHPGFFNDLLMLAACGGRERSRGDWESLLNRAGFRLTAVHTSPATELCVLECRPDPARS